MQLKQVEIIKFRNFENITINFEKNKFPNIYSVASKNGGGKSTLLQFIFIMLHCFIDENKKEYIINILEEFSDITDDIKVVKFVVQEDEVDYDLEFYITQDKRPEYDYQLYLDLATIDKKLKRLPSLEFIEASIDISENVDIELKLKSEINILQIHYKEKKDRINRLEKMLEKDDLYYITHLKTHENILLLNTKMPFELLKKLSNKIFLGAPSTQAFLFLNKKTREKIFNMHSYCDSISSIKENLDGFYTYDFASTELILDAFRQAIDKDAQIKRVTGQYGTKYDELSSNLKEMMDEKDIIENKNATEIIFRLEDSDKALSQDELSHGELKKLGLYIWLLTKVKDNSIVLMDEVDIALHPKWQYELSRDLTKWSQGSQFILATHSPQILSSTYYKNLIFLERKENRTIVKQPNEMFTDNDINTIITLGMDATHIPPKLANLQFEYRELIEDNQENSDKAKELKDKILEWESADSAFFKRIDMYLRFNK